MLSLELQEYILKNYAVFITEEEYYVLNYGFVEESEKIKIAERIYKDHQNEIFINKCPICGTLARTPLAKQALCGHRWSSSE
jgi:hypothetical protein